MKYACTLLLMLGTCSLRAASEGALPAGADSVANIYNLNEVVVTSTRTPLLLKETPVITRVVSAREIEKSGLKTIQDVLETELAGVEFHQAGYGSSISFQGLDARYILFLVDGERLAGETYGNIDYARIPLGNIERIEIVRGASSVLYGSNAMGAVVNVITRKAGDGVTIRASGRYAGRYQKNAETVGGLKSDSRLDIPNLSGDLSVGFALGKLRSQTSLTYSGSDAYSLRSETEEMRHYYDSLKIVSMRMGPTGPTASVRTVADTVLKAPADTTGLSVSGWRNFGLTQRFDYRFSDRLAFFAGGSYFRKSRYDFPESMNTGTAEGKNWTYETYDSYNVKAGLEYRPDDRNVWLLTYNGDIYRRSMDSLQYSVPKQRHGFHAPRLLWTVEAGRRNRITTGAEYVHETLNFDLSVHGYDDRRTLNTAALYVQDEISTGVGLSFTAGVRGDYSDRFGWSVTPKASARYALGDFSLRANYARGYRTPTLKEMYMNYLIPMGAMAGQTYIVGNAGLKPEYNDYLSLSAEYSRGFTNLSVTAFKSYFRDKIDVRQESGGAGSGMGAVTRLVYNNVSRSEFSGIEAVFRARLARGLFVMGNYNYIAQTEEAPEASTQYIFVSPHTATWQISYDFAVRKTGVGLNLGGRYVGTKEYEGMMPVIEYGKGGRMPSAVYSGTYRARHGAYTLWNAAVTVGLASALRVTVGMENLFDYKAEVINFNSCIAPPRHAFVRLAFDFGK